MAESKQKKWNYTYDYPQQRELARNLSHEDKQLVAQKTGYTMSYVNYMCRGRRRMKTHVEQLIKKIYKVKRQMQAIEVEEYQES